MRKLLKLKVWIMIALLGYSTNLYANNQTDFLNLSMGKVFIPEDSVLISYDDLRIVNSKLIQLDYEKQIIFVLL